MKIVLLIILVLSIHSACWALTADELNEAEANIQTAIRSLRQMLTTLTAAEQRRIDAIILTEDQIQQMRDTYTSAKTQLTTAVQALPS